MKLPDFTDNPQLKALRKKMGATAPGEFRPTYRPSVLTKQQLEDLAEGGIEVTFDEITELDDGTLAYKDQRVLVYIRDVSFFNGKFDLPRFHFASCRTLWKMRNNNQFGKYVIATRDDGTFRINKIVHGENTGPDSFRLNVCQNCLDLLKFDGFSLDLSSAIRTKKVSDFEIKRFFELYPKSLHSMNPNYDADSAPVNQYSPGFSEAAKKYKYEQNWICEKCNLAFSNSADRKYLHVHHQNSLKYDDSRENFRALCFGCHAEEPQHAHMKNLGAYKEFIAEHGARWLVAKRERSSNASTNDTPRQI